MKIEVEISEKNEYTSAPWWIIIDPEPLDRGHSVNRVASCITGPFFSRESAQSHLSNRYYDFSGLACVYCSSGYSSLEYRNAIRDAEKRHGRRMGDLG